MNDASRPNSPSSDSGTGSSAVTSFESEPIQNPFAESDYIEYCKRRRKVLPLCLFVLTLLSTFYAGVTNWMPIQVFTDVFERMSFMQLRQLVLENWEQGLWYMGAVVLILGLHEMGHFVATVIYRVPASHPFFLPFPLNPIGTLGAVIAMYANVANRKQIFDIGIAGPIAGLVAAVPIAFVGISQLDLTSVPNGGLGFRLPLAMQWIAEWYNVPGYVPGEPVWINQLNPLFCAAWVGFLITGLNMMPVGQLDGGHVTYTLFGNTAHLIAKATIVFAIAFMVYHLSFILILMVMLVLLMGTDHPPTADDNVPIGPFRWALGLTSLVIPILCFPPLIFEIVM